MRPNKIIASVNQTSNKDEYKELDNLVQLIHSTPENGLYFIKIYMDMIRINQAKEVSVSTAKGFRIQLGYLSFRTSI